MPGMSSDFIDEIRVQSYLVREQQGLIWVARNPDALMPRCLSEMPGTSPTYFLWEHQWLEPAMALQSRLSERCYSEGSVVQIIRPAPLGCSVRITLCITPDTEVSCRVFALAHIEAGWMPQSLAQYVVWRAFNRLGDPRSLLGGDPPVA